jgi:hypothetical protein
LTPVAIVKQFRTFQSKWGTELIDKERAKWTGRLNKTDDIDMMYGWISERLAYLDTKYSETEAPDIPDEPDEPEKTLTSISATYSGGDVAVGTAVTALTGVVVTAHYSDGTSESVTGYTLSGTIAEGSNTVTVTYQGITATFTVTGVSESGEEEPDVPVSDILYQLASPVVCNGDGTVFDTGATISAVDMDFTFCTKITSNVQTSIALVVGDGEPRNQSGLAKGFNITRGRGWSKIHTLYAMGKSTSVPDDWIIQSESQSIIVVSHVANSGTYSIKMAYPTKEGRESNSPSTATCTASFVAHDSTVKIGSDIFAGSVDDLVIYNRVLSDEEINAYLGVA